MLSIFKETEGSSNFVLIIFWKYDFLCLAPCRGWNVMCATHVFRCLKGGRGWKCTHGCVLGARFSVIICWSVCFWQTPSLGQIAGLSLDLCLANMKMICFQKSFAKHHLYSKLTSFSFFSTTSLRVVYDNSIFSSWTKKISVLYPASYTGPG